MRIFYCTVLIVSVFFCSCNNGGEKAPEKKAEKAPMSSNLSKDGTGKLMEVTVKYYALKNALVASDAAKTKDAGQNLLKAVKSFTQTDTVDKGIVKPYLDSINTYGAAIVMIEDATCEKQRIAFSSISTAMYGMLKSTGFKNAGIYKQYCPMAFNDKGAYWLSEEEEIKNPYFGKKMLECGEVQDSL